VTDCPRAVVVVLGLADATLVRVAERDAVRQVFTLDRRDFEVYRIGRRETFTIIP